MIDYPSSFCGPERGWPQMTPGVTPPPQYRLGYEGNSTNYGKGRGMQPSSTIWLASSFLVPCPYCEAPAFEMCHTYGSPGTKAQYVHSGRSWAGHEVIKRILRVQSSRDTQAMLADEPAPESATQDEFVGLVRKIVVEELKKAAKTPPRKRAAATKRAAPKKAAT